MADSPSKSYGTATMTSRRGARTASGDMIAGRPSSGDDFDGVGVRAEGPVERIDMNEAIERIGVGYFHKYAGLVCGLANAADAVELLSIGYIIPEIDISSEEKGALSAAVFVGMLIGGFVAGVVADSMGRKPSLLVSLGINAVFGLLSAGMPNWELLALCRVISGVGVGGSVPVVFTLFVEYLSVAGRGMLLNVVAMMWMVGSIYAAGVAWLVIGHLGLSWRVYALLAAIPAILAFGLVSSTLPESPRYFYNHGKLIKANAVLQRISKLCDRPCPIVEGRVALATPTGAGRERPTTSCQALGQSFKAMKPLFGSTLLRTTTLLSVAWFTLSFGWYGLILWIPTLFKDADVNLDEYLNAFLVAAANLPGNLFALFALDRMGRKSLLSSSMMISAMLAVIFGFTDNAYVIVTVACLLNAVSVSGWNALDCLSTESFPTALRSSGMGYLAGCGRVGSIVGQLIFGWLIDVSTKVLLTTAGLMLACGAVAGWMLPTDTANRQLVDTVAATSATITEATALSTTDALADMTDDRFQPLHQPAPTPGQGPSLPDKSGGVAV